MKKLFCRISSILIALYIVFGISALPVMAMEMENEGLEVKILYDKEIYEEGEPITATISVKNISGEAVIIRDIEQLVPEGYKLAQDLPEYEEDIVLSPEDVIEIKVTYGEEVVEEEGGAEAFFDKVIFGESFGIPNILIAVLAIIGIALFYYFT